MTRKHNWTKSWLWRTFCFHRLLHRKIKPIVQILLSLQILLNFNSHSRVPARKLTTWYLLSQPSAMIEDITSHNPLHALIRSRLFRKLTRFLIRVRFLLCCTSFHPTLRWNEISNKWRVKRPRPEGDFLNCNLSNDICEPPCWDSILDGLAVWFRRKGKLRANSCAPPNVFICMLDLLLPFLKGVLLHR